MEKIMQYDVIIIGSGPAGYIAAIRAGQVGLKTAIIEKYFIGGMCLNWGCIPSKAIIESAKYFDRLRMADEFGVEGIDQRKISFNWSKAKNRAMDIVKKLTGGVEYLLKKNGVDIIRGEAKITSRYSVTVDNRSIEAKNIIIATGSYPADLDFEIPKKHLLELETLYDVQKLPSSVAVVGYGGVAVEMAQFFSLINRKVTLVAPSKTLMPGVDQYLNDYIYNKLKNDGITLIEEKDIKEYKNGKLYAGKHEIECEKVLNASIREAVLPEIGIVIEKEEGYIKTDDKLRTNVDNIYAVGDVNGKSHLAHVGSAQGLFVINNIKGVKGAIDLHNYPVNIYTNPEIAQIGLTEQEIQERNIPYKISEFPLSANAKALIEGYDDGNVRMLSEKRYGEVLGVQIVAPHATDMIAEAAAFMQIESTVYDVARLIHAHPTISEVFMEAGFDAVDKAIHK
ncbi:MAG: dihydrolipoyl dehydrogenase [Bacteroidales bacterium]